MIKLLLSFFVIFISINGLAQLIPQVRRIDSLVARIETSQSTKIIGVREVNDDPLYIPDRYVLDSTKKKLLKVIHKKILEENPFYYKDTATSDYYFLDSSLIKVAQIIKKCSDSSLLSKNYYFENSKIIYKAGQLNGKEFILEEEDIVTSFMERAARYISFFKSFPK